jgi:hypothetical protein
MNNYLTYCAQAKLLHLMADRGATSVRLTALPQGSVSIEMMCTELRHNDIMLSSTPKVFTDLFTLKQLKRASVDFDYPTAEFIITREKHVISPHAR